MSNRGRDAGVFAVVAALAVIWVMLASAPKSSAIPAFSRKYQTSCTTCHNNYPELNDFGEAFKKNGFKFPNDDETFVKEPPVLLGSKAQKEAFPGAVYPGEIPGFLPIAFRYSGNFTWNAKQPQAVQATSYAPQTDLFEPNTFTIISAGSFGPNLAFWIDNDLSTSGSGAGGGLGDGYLRYNDIGHIFGLPNNSLNVRFGQFEPDLPFTQARSIYPSAYDVFSEVAVGQGPACNANATPPVLACQTASNPFVLGVPQRGIEFGGYPNNGNFTWSFAVFNGTNSNYGLTGASAPLTARNTKDIYIRVSQKFNLERDPESRHAVQAAGPTGPRDHTSIRLGAFYYHGWNEYNYGGSQFPFTGTIQEPFYRAGGDIRIKYRKMELFGVGMVGHDNNHFVDQTVTPPTIVAAHAVTYTGGFAGSNFWIYPWMIGYLRYDFVNSPTDFLNGISPTASQYKTRNRVSPGFQVLLRANIKIIGEYQYHWGVPYTDTTVTPPVNKFYRPNSFVSGIDYVF